MKIAVIILTKNEEQIITEVISSAKNVLDSMQAITYKIFVWDDSTDATAEQAKKMSVEVIKGSQRSLGWTYYEIMKSFSKKLEYDLILTMDGDGQVDAKEIPIFVEKIRNGCDMVVGSRFKGKNFINYKYPLINHIGVKLLSSLISFCCLKKFTDAHGGIRVMKREVLENFKFLGRHSYVQETIIDASSRGYKVCEIASAWNERLYGESRVVASPIVYAKKMTLPLMLRARVHLYLSLLSLIFALITANKLLYISATLFCFLELYKRFLYNKNNSLLGSY